MSKANREPDSAPETEPETEPEGNAEGEAEMVFETSDGAVRTNLIDFMCEDMVGKTLCLGDGQEVVVESAEQAARLLTEHGSANIGGTHYRSHEVDPYSDEIVHHALIALDDARGDHAQAFLHLLTAAAHLVAISDQPEVFGVVATKALPNMIRMACKYDPHNGFAEQFEEALSSYGNTRRRREGGHLDA